jgi:putative tryptophan/tyrosine transport system substrate-binding protein
MRRREFIAGLGGAAAWPLVVRAQAAERIRRIGVLITFDETDPVAKAFVPAFSQRLRTWVGEMVATYGWTSGGAAVISIGYERSRRSW